MENNLEPLTISGRLLNLFSEKKILGYCTCCGDDIYISVSDQMNELHMKTGLCYQCNLRYNDPFSHTMFIA